ncbi:biosynthetic peptidoglycan transglycosylase, partial [Novosphingobium sp.]|uniref:biosynthetic peptidoglycan transglycosylase n=1 Tax=Novosphingobium sp. TaxID=1874826 RepID=UPI001D2C82E6
MARRDLPRRSEPERSSSRRQRDPQEPSFLRRWLRRLLIWGAAVTLLGAMALAVAVFVTERSLPSYERMKSTQTGQTIVVRASDGSEIVTLGPSYGRWVPYERIPQTLKDAMISVEDRRFRDHWGVDPIGIVRSVMVRIQTGHWRQGGSTITQQLARNIFLNNSRTFDRKIREALLAMAI